MSKPSILLLFFALFLLSPLIALATAPPVLKGKRSSAYRISYTLDVTVAKGGPDCYQRDVILVNGLFQPTLEVMINDTVKVRGKAGDMHGGCGWGSMGALSVRTL